MFIMVSSFEGVKQSKKTVILIVLREAEDQCTAILELSGAVHQTQHDIPEDFSLQQHGCVGNLPRCPQKELFKKCGLEYGIIHL